MSGTRRRSFRGWLLAVAFVVVPLVEIYVIIQVGEVIGAWWTILLLIADSLFGAWMVKREGGRAWRALRTALEERRMPARELADGMLILVGGAFILSPGFVLDAIGLLCILPLTRPIGRRVLSKVISRKLVGVSFGAGPAGGEASWTRRRPGPGGPARRVVRRARQRGGPGRGGGRPARAASLRQARGLRRLSARRPPSSCGRWHGAGAPDRSRRRAAARGAR